MTHLAPFPSVFIVDFEQVNVNWESFFAFSHFSFWILHLRVLFKW